MQDREEEDEDDDSDDGYSPNEDDEASLGESTFQLQQQIFSWEFIKNP